MAERGPRKPNARATDVVLGSLAERIDVLESATDVLSVSIHAARLRELIGELKRSLKRQPAEPEDE